MIRTCDRMHAEANRQFRNFDTFSPLRRQITLNLRGIERSFRTIVEDSKAVISQTLPSCQRFSGSLRAAESIIF